VPLSPVASTGTSLAAKRRIWSSTSFIAGLLPTMYTVDAPNAPSRRERGSQGGASLRPLAGGGTAASSRVTVSIPDDSHLTDTLRHSSQLTVIAQEQSFFIESRRYLERDFGADELRAHCCRARSSCTGLAANPAAPEAPSASAPSSTLVARDLTEPEEVRLTKRFLMPAH
jgi:hypothetical protein